MGWTLMTRGTPVNAGRCPPSRQPRPGPETGRLPMKPSGVWETVKRASRRCSMSRQPSGTQESPKQREPRWMWLARRQEAFTRTARAHARLGEFSRALETARGIEDASRQAETLIGIAELQAEAGEIEAARADRKSVVQGERGGAE